MENFTTEPEMLQSLDIATITPAEAERIHQARQSWRGILTAVKSRKRDKDREREVLLFLSAEMASEAPRRTVVDRLSSTVFRIRSRRHRADLYAHLPKRKR